MVAQAMVAQAMVAQAMVAQTMLAQAMLAQAMLAQAMPAHTSAWGAAGIAVPVITCDIKPMPPASLTCRWRVVSVAHAATIADVWSAATRR